MTAWDDMGESGYKTRVAGERKDTFYHENTKVQNHEKDPKIFGLSRPGFMNCSG